MNESKRCSKCGEVKPLGEFTKDSKSPDGLQYYCRVCKYERGLFRSNNEQGRMKISDAMKRYRDSNKIKTRARHAIEQGINAGRIIPQPCEVCDSTDKIQAHHDDYSKPLDVRWLCYEHHLEVHGKRPVGANP